MNGADALVNTLLAGGVDTCFANPGTSEMHIVATLDRGTDMRSILCLFEGVATAAADGYARLRGSPAATLLHLGPGLANGLANLHNARRARSPLINIVGEHASAHQHLEAPLTADIDAFARPVSHWIRYAASSDSVAHDGALAIQAARTPPGRIATLIVPADCAWNAVQGDVPAIIPDPPPPCLATPDWQSLGEAFGHDARQVALLLNGKALQPPTLERLARLAAATGATLIGDTFISRQPRGEGRPAIERLPYFAEAAIERLSNFRHLVLVDTQAPVAFFAYPGVPSELAPPGCRVHVLSRPGENTDQTVAELLERLSIDSRQKAALARFDPPAKPSGALDAEVIARAVGHHLPEQAIVVNEAISSSYPLNTHTACSRQHDWLDLTGGAIGIGLPLAVGAAIAAPERRVLTLQADGSGLYTLQALWTQAREGLDITTIIYANRRYAILQIEFDRVGAHQPGERAESMMTLDRPGINWLELARGFGVPGERVDTGEALSAALARSFAGTGPYLIEALCR